MRIRGYLLLLLIILELESQSTVIKNIGFLYMNIFYRRSYDFISNISDYQLHSKSQTIPLQKK